MKKFLLVCTLSLMFASSAFAQNIDKNSDCWRGLTKQHKTLIASAMEHRADMSASEAQAFNDKLNKLEADWTKAQQGDVTQQVCQWQLDEIRNLQFELDKMKAATIFKLAACVAEFEKITAESNKIFTDGLAKKQINEKESAEHKIRVEALQKRFTVAAINKKLPKAKCDEFLNAATDEKIAVIKMTAAIQTMPPARPGLAPTIAIKKANYGENCSSVSKRKMDLTSNFKKACDGKTSCSYTINAFGVDGDPAPNCPKELIVTYSCGSGDKTLKIDKEAHGKVAQFDCSK